MDISTISEFFSVLDTRKISAFHQLFIKEEYLSGLSKEGSSMQVQLCKSRILDGLLGFITKQYFFTKSPSIFL